MFDLKTILVAIQQIAGERDISEDRVREIVEAAFAAAYRREYRTKNEIVRARFNPKTGDLSFYQVKLVVDESMLQPEGEEETGEQYTEDESGQKKIKFNQDRHIMLDEARKIRPNIFTGEELEFPLETKTEFGRIAAQTAKQTVLQKLHETEKENLFNQFKAKEGEIISGIIQRTDGRNTFVDLGKTTGVLFSDETIPFEHYRIGDRMKFYVVSVEQTNRGLSIVLSRSHPRFIVKLFASEVPEIAEGTVEIKSIAREAGSRTKIAVASNNDSIDPIGACVGQKGTRVTTVIQELGNEKIDIILWSDDPAAFITNALAPAKVTDAQVRPDHSARVFVPADQLSLAIGRDGQNVRLAHRLTDWRIEIRSAARPNEIVEGGSSEPPETEHTAKNTIEIQAVVSDTHKTESEQAGIDTTDESSESA
ncbi:MAG: transcription termination/antitermination protein NusA [Candidatus Brennerbacteria bacterium CG11_big_fil_rev_8_21_14_0_20_43_10]|uniref:Transcription termination/antitermination protein NusA n=2 Tax=Candidatus Brenneribacteriota TaxID=1817902 RepID=A0A2M8C2K9_9BACT|nr:MAG: transcription termination factor NusA [Parcubacteria group bacterium CG1_02_44_31]PIP50244.1 MAG: transcription termination/antitermination protein NusA [Candidatus Brennerbacteria bacterium CG23_combo_of_CG06-09_8_20_14_all_44_41]PIR26931.1 MAG: transcription termination/antitermination protein NusA [Candidatus Brennerbacteria bacterium CG11_big_fil_rev_8_21_14_0_20_43_10]PJA18957.1 MAG: transcription termination/antitermination protein NusA [Candidatus Brennerbacteria bacterium CG_4_10